MKSKKLLLLTLKTVAVMGFWFAVWVLISFRINSEFFFPSPVSVTKALVELAATSEFWITAGYSLLRVVSGILVSLIIGSLLAVLTENSKWLKALLSPLLGIIKATPVASFIILALLWLERDSLPVFITSLIVIPIVWSNVSEGIRSVDKNLIEVTKIYKFTHTQKLTRLYLPSISPFFMAACKSSLGMAWKAGISAEVLSTPQKAIGTELYFSKTYLETPSLFAWTLVVIVMSIIIEKLFVFSLERLGSKLGILHQGGNDDKA